MEAIQDPSVLFLFTDKSQYESALMCYQCGDCKLSFKEYLEKEFFKTSVSSEVTIEQGEEEEEEEEEEKEEEEEEEEEEKEEEEQESSSEEEEWKEPQGDMFQVLMVGHVLHTIQYLEGYAKKDKEMVHKAKHSLKINLCKWKEKFDVINKSGSQWKVIMKEHNSAAVMLIENSVNHNETEAIKALGLLMKNKGEVVKFIEQHFQHNIDESWTKHLTCTKSYIEARAASPFRPNEYKEKKEECFKNATEIGNELGLITSKRIVTVAGVSYDASKIPVLESKNATEIGQKSDSLASKKKVTVAGTSYDLSKIPVLDCKSGKKKVSPALKSKIKIGTQEDCCSTPKMKKMLQILSLYLSEDKPLDSIDGEIISKLKLINKSIKNQEKLNEDNSEPFGSVCLLNKKERINFLEISSKVVDIYNGNDDKMNVESESPIEGIMDSIKLALLKSSLRHYCKKRATTPSKQIEYEAMDIGKSIIRNILKDINPNLIGATLAIISTMMTVSAFVFKNKAGLEVKLRELKDAKERVLEKVKESNPNCESNVDATIDADFLTKRAIGQIKNRLTGYIKSTKEVQYDLSLVVGNARRLFTEVVESFNTKDGVPTQKFDIKVDAQRVGVLALLGLNIMYTMGTINISKKEMGCEVIKWLDYALEEDVALTATDKDYSDYIIKKSISYVKKNKLMNSDFILLLPNQRAMPETVKKQIKSSEEDTKDFIQRHLFYKIPKHPNYIFSVENKMFSFDVDKKEIGDLGTKSVIKLEGKKKKMANSNKSVIISIYATDKML